MLMASREVIESIAFPHFEHPVPGYGEDRLFCEKARQKGFKVYVDCGCSIGHLTPRPVTKADALSFLNSTEGQAMYQRPVYPEGWSEANELRRAEILERSSSSAE